MKSVSFHIFSRYWPHPIYWRFKFNPNPKEKYGYAYSLMHGVRRHGYKVKVARRRDFPSDDISVFWGWKPAPMLEEAFAAGHALVIMERGFIQPRNQWVSLAVGGLNGRGKFAPAEDGGERWNRYFAPLLRPWRQSAGDYALVIGQVPGDAALNGADIVKWAQRVTDELLNAGHRVVYRPHPIFPTPCPRGAVPSTGKLADDLRNADRVVVYNSTTAVESILAGIPTVVFDEGSVAFSMASHAVGEPLIRPDRTQWCHDLAWKQWSEDELSSGAAWEHVQKALV